MLKVYAYKNCDTCRKALKWLESKKISHKVLAIRETPPSQGELKTMLKAQGDLRKLFNTSGGDYKELGLKNKLQDLGDVEAIQLLASNGNLVKRPFVVGPDIALVGFKEQEWAENLKP